LTDSLSRASKQKLEKFINEKNFESPTQAKRSFQRSNSMSAGAKSAIASEFNLKKVEGKKNLFRLKNGRFF